MRSGINPEKFKSEKNLLKNHRVIIPVHIPNLKSEYYKDGLLVFQEGLNSLIKSIDKSFTAITVVNNFSCEAVSTFLQLFLQEGFIEKLVQYGENKGKVFAVMQEARSSYEPFITIADADVIFFPGWEKAVFNIFQGYEKAGVVSPVPSQNLGLYKNCSVFFDNYLTGGIKYGKVVKDKDCDLFLKGLGNPELLTRNNSLFSWREKQYFLKDPVTAVLGANHYIATYKREVLLYNAEFPEARFKKGYEEKFLDEPADKLGWYRLSTAQTFAYHMGNKTDDVTPPNIFRDDYLLTKAQIQKIFSAKKSIIPYIFKRLFFKVLRQIKKL